MIDNQNIEKEFKELFRVGELTRKEMRDALGISAYAYNKLRLKFFPGIKKKTRYYKDAKQRFVEMCESPNYTVQDISDELEIARGTVHRWRRELMPQGFRKGALRYQEFVILYKLGRFTLPRIAEMLGCHSGTATRYRAKYYQEKEAQSAVDSTLEENGEES